MGARLSFKGKQRFPTPPDRLHDANDGSSNQESIKGTLGVPQFSLLGSSPEDRKRRWLVLGFSPVLEAFAVAIMFWALMSLPPNPLTETAKQDVLYYFHTATPPPPPKQHPRLLERPIQPPPVAATPILPRLRREAIQKPAETVHLKAPRISRPQVQLPKTPPAPKPVEHFTEAEVFRPTPKRQTARVQMGAFAPTAKLSREQRVSMVRTGAFNPGSMAKGTVKRPSREVQTGGFGADNGIPNDPAADSHMRVAQLGSFDLPSGPGHGNGTGGARGVRGTVASAGFGNGIGEATGGRMPGVARHSIHQSGFGSVVAGTKAPRTHRAAREAAVKPVVILSKPNPVYPPEARRDHIEGQVILSVLFGASGHVRVLKVERGLGHGMDAAAIQAAEHIKFKPAERSGRPVNFTATVHIVFQLAY